MKRIIYISIVLLLLLGSCTKELDLTIGDAPLPDGSVRIALVGASGAKRLQTKASNNPSISAEKEQEEHIRKIQVFFYDEANMLETVRTYDATATVNNEITWTSGQSEMTVNRLTQLGKPKTIYVVTNWLTDADIPIGSPLSRLTDQITSITGPLGVPSNDAPILMSGCTETPFLFHENNEQTTAKKATILIKRQQVKVIFTLNINATFLVFLQQAGYEIDPENEASIQVHNLPLASYITEQSPAKSPENVNFHTIESVPLVRLGTSNTWNYTQYSYENPILGIDASGEKSKLMSSTYFTILLPLKNTAGTVIKNYYRAYIKDPNDPENPYKTIRNHIYNVSLTVIGFGIEEPVFESINTITTIENWVDIPLNVDISGKDMTLNKTSVMLIGKEEDNSLIARGTTALDASLLPNLFSEITYSTGMTEGLLLGIERIDGDDKSIRIKIQNSAAVAYEATFYIQYGAYKKKISVTYIPPRNTIGYFGGNPKIPATKEDEVNNFTICDAAIRTFKLCREQRL